MTRYLNSTARLSLTRDSIHGGNVGSLMMIAWRLWSSEMFEPLKEKLMTTTDDLSRLLAIAEKIRRAVFHFNTEDELQQGIEQLLLKHHLPVKREVLLNASSRIDFMVEGIGIEVKIDAG